MPFVALRVMVLRDAIIVTPTPTIPGASLPVTVLSVTDTCTIPGAWWRRYRRCDCGYEAAGDRELGFCSGVVRKLIVSRRPGLD